jgi:quinol-cytochrome oxidoreductase complex cytochrome b subunit
VTVGTNLIGSVPIIGEKTKFVVLGGNVTDQNALLRFYVLHCFLLPGLAATLMAIHFWRIRKDGGISGPPPEGNDNNIVAELSEEGETSGSPTKTYGLMAMARETSPHVDKQPEDTADTFPHLVYRELIMVILATAALALLSFFFMAPLEELANPEFPPHPAKAPWYFLGIQEMVSWMSPFLAGVVIPGLMVAALLMLPYVDRNPRGVGTWFHPSRKKLIILFTAWVVFMGVLILIGSYCRGPGWEWYWPWEPWH